MTDKKSLPKKRLCGFKIEEQVYKRLKRHVYNHDDHMMNMSKFVNSAIKEKLKAER